MVAVHGKNLSLQQNFETQIPQIILEGQQYCQIKNCNHIDFLQEFRKHYHSSMQLQPLPSRCQSKIFIFESRKLLQDLCPIQKIKSIEEYHELVQQGIKPLNLKLKNWRDSGLCPNCMTEYNRQDFDISIHGLDKVITDQFKANRIGRLKKFLIFFQSSLDLFLQTFNCVENS